MPDWIVANLEQLFDALINGAMFVVLLFCVILAIGLAVDELERRKR